MGTADSGRSGHGSVAIFPKPCPMLYSPRSLRTPRSIPSRAARVLVRKAETDLVDTERILAIGETQQGGEVDHA